MVDKNKEQIDLHFTTPLLLSFFFKKQREQEAEELKQLENELKKSLVDGEDEVVDDAESSESQEAGKVNNVDLHKVMGVPKDAKGVSAAVAIKLRSKADVSSHQQSLFATSIKDCQ